MIVDTPDGILEIPVAKAVIKKLRGVDVVVIDGRYFFNYSEYSYIRFCEQTDYHEVLDMLPESIDVKPIFNDESLLAYSWWHKDRWEDIDNKMISLRNYLSELETLIN